MSSIQRSASAFAIADRSRTDEWSQIQQILKQPFTVTRADLKKPEDLASPDYDIHVLKDSNDQVVSVAVFRMFDHFVWLEWLCTPSNLRGQGLAHTLLMRSQRYLTTWAAKYRNARGIFFTMLSPSGMSGHTIFLPHEIERLNSRIANCTTRGAIVLPIDFRGPDLESKRRFYSEETGLQHETNYNMPVVPLQLLCLPIEPTCVTDGPFVSNVLGVISHHVFRYAEVDVIRAARLVRPEFFKFPENDTRLGSVSRPYRHRVVRKRHLLHVTKPIVAPC